MNKQKTLRRTSVIVVAVLLITMSLLCGTLAKFTTKLEASDSVAIAKWNFTVNGSPSAFTFDLGDGPIAPGSTGTVVLKLKNDSEVAATYNIAHELSGTKPTGLTVAADEALTGTLAVGAELTVTLTWTWADSADDTTFASTTTGEKQVTLKVTVTGTQA